MHLALAGEVLVPVPATCDLDSTSLEIRAAIGDDADAACVVTNAHGVVLGRIRAEDLPDAEGRLLGMLHRHDAERALTERRHPL